MRVRLEARVIVLLISFISKVQNQNLAETNAVSILQFLSEVDTSCRTSSRVLQKPHA